METVEEHQVVRRIGEYLVAQLDSILAEGGLQKRVKLWRLLRSHREKLLQLCAVLTPSYDPNLLHKDLQIVREIQKELNNLHEWSVMINPKEYTRLWRPQGASVLNNPLGAHGFNVPREDKLIAAHSERDILTALLQVKKPPKVAQLRLGEAVLETLVWRIRMCKRKTWETLSHVELLLEPGTMLQVPQTPPMTTFTEFLSRIWRVCGGRRLIQLSVSAQAELQNYDLVARFMPNASELLFYDKDELTVKVCLDEGDGLRCEKDGVVVEGVPVWQCRSAVELMYDVRMRRLKQTRDSFLAEINSWKFFSKEEIEMTDDGLIIRAKESPRMEVRLQLASSWGQKFQEKEEEEKPYLSLLMTKTSGWSAPGFGDLSTVSARRKAAKNLRRGAFLAAILEGSNGKWDQIKEPEYEENRVLVKIVRRVDEGETPVIGQFTFECYEWGIRNIRIGWSTVNHYLPLELPPIFDLYAGGFQGIDCMTREFWSRVNAELDKCKFNEWDIFISSAKRFYPEFTHLKDGNFTWDRAVNFQLLKSPIRVEFHRNPRVTGIISGLKCPPKSEGTIVHNFPDAVLRVEKATINQRCNFEYRGPLRHFFRDLKGLEEFAQFVERGSITRGMWESKQYVLEFPEEDGAPAVTLRPNQVRWARPFLIGPALESLLKSNGPRAFVRARKQWGPLLALLPPEENHVYYVVKRPPAVVLFFPTSPGRRIGAVFRPGHVDCWTTFNKKAVAKHGKGISAIPHLSDGHVGKIASNLTNIPAIITYLKTYSQMKTVQEALSKRYLKLQTWPPSLTCPGFTYTIIEEDEPLEYLIDFVCHQQEVAESAYALWDALQSNTDGLKNFLAFLDVLAENEEIVKKRPNDINDLMRGDRILVDWVNRPPTVEKLTDKNMQFTVVKFHIGRKLLEARYGQHGGFVVFQDGEKIEGRWTSLFALSTEIRDKLEKELEQKKLEKEQEKEKLVKGQEQKERRKQTAAHRLELLKQQHGPSLGPKKQKLEDN